MKITALTVIAALACSGCVGATTHPMTGKTVTSHTTSVPLKPPAAYWGPFPGKVEHRYIYDTNAWGVCSGNGKLDQPKNVVACSGVVDGVCIVYIAVEKPGLDFDAVMRHEIAHCNGWPANHPDH